MFINRKKNVSSHKIKDRTVVILASVLFVLSFAARLYFAGASAAKNVELKDLYSKKSSLEQEVSRLSYDELRLSTMSLVREKASVAGFVIMSSPLLSLDITLSPPLASANTAR